MMLRSGWLVMNKRERAEIELLLQHAEHDISYNAGGTYAKNAGMSEDVDEKAVAKARRAIESIRWILSSYLDGHVG